VVENLFTVPETSKLLKISPHTLRSWIFQRKVPVVRLGRRVFFREKDLEEMIKKGFQDAN